LAFPWPWRGPVSSGVGELGDEEVEPLLLTVRGNTAAVGQDGHAVQRTPDDFGEQFASRVVRAKTADEFVEGGAQRGRCLGVRELHVGRHDEHGLVEGGPLGSELQVGATDGMQGLPWLGVGQPGTAQVGGEFAEAVKAVRDMACGFFIFIPLASGSPHLLGWVMLAATGIPVGDALIVLRSNGPRAAVYGIHGATAVVLLAISVLLLIA
jgi:hypothetical protein